MTSQDDNAILSGAAGKKGKLSGAQTPSTEDQSTQTYHPSVTAATNTELTCVFMDDETILPDAAARGRELTGDQTPSIENRSTQTDAPSTTASKSTELTEKTRSPSDEERSEFQCRLETHRPTLRQHLECGYGLLDELSSRGVLSREQVADIDRPQTSKYEQNDKLLSILHHNADMLQADKLDSLIASLKLTHQRHIASFFTNVVSNSEGSFRMSLSLVIPLAH